jgi:serine-type D-Ala-D-Ala carboxypeptidase/endopeptidase (penicillin-binding protein 4)
MVRLQSRALASLVLLLTTSLLSACATHPAPAVPRASLAATIDAALDQAPFDRAFWSVLVEDEAGQAIYSRNAEKLTIPASNRKLFSAAAIAACVGLDSRLETSIWRDGEDLVVVGGGDPTLGSARYERAADFSRVASALRARGLTAVRDVIVDVSLFDRVIIPGGWKHGNIGSGYAAPVDAIAWSENQTPDGRAVADPGLYAAAALRDALTLAGISVRGELRLNVDARQWDERVDTLNSPYVVQMLTTVLKNSQNLYTEMLLKRSGIESDARPVTYGMALERERRFLMADAGLDPDAFRFVDGSGLAPDNLVTPAATIGILRWMNHPSRRGLWWALLAQPANEGTLRGRLVPLEDRMRGKTGTVAGVNALSGIIAMPGGGFRYFSIAVNHHIGSGADALRIIDDVVTQIAE